MCPGLPAETKPGYGLLQNSFEKIALENPVSIISSRIRSCDQIIQPWQHGNDEDKKTCLWLKNLPRLKPSKIVESVGSRIHKMPPGPDRWKERSRTFAGVAEAMGDQWGGRTLQPCANQLALL